MLPGSRGPSLSPEPLWEAGPCLAGVGSYFPRTDTAGAEVGHGGVSGPHNFPSGTSCPATTGSCLRATRGVTDFTPPEPAALTRVWKLGPSWAQEECLGCVCGWVGEQKHRPRGGPAVAMRGSGGRVDCI